MAMITALLFLAACSIGFGTKQRKFNARITAFVLCTAFLFIDIAHGVEANKNGYPWLLSLQRDFGPDCGGSILRIRENDASSDIGLTAAHCVW